MAVKNRLLDDKIIKSAWNEFTEKGFQNASLHKIANSAGITTGALYTRYKSKDELFCSLVENAVFSLIEKAETLKEMYYSVQKIGDTKELFRVIDCEKREYLDVLFEYYDECKLLFCRSTGSSAEKIIKQMSETKVRQTVEYIKEISVRPLNMNGIEMIITGQLNFYQMILENGYTKEQAFSCMDTVNTFFEAGWRALLEKSTK
ncbi:MAG: TetR/AcrR family transcriptional regulator [Ruminococcus sp.]|nr:TetR/AcrR family transcriptional regulator [Ruminococcus sp.]MCM1480776.1 TetR/AcrR family transcriptional regulator [Muribaculaceae bacterium]